MTQVGKLPKAAYSEFPHEIGEIEMPRHDEGMVAWKAHNDEISWRNYWAWQLHVNQGWRDADLLAHIGGSFLFEYEMPSGKRYLHEVDIGRDCRFEPIGKSISKSRLPVKWQLAEWFIDPHEILGGDG